MDVGRCVPKTRHPLLAVLFLFFPAVGAANENLPRDLKYAWACEAGWSTNGEAMTEIAVTDNGTPLHWTQSSGSYAYLPGRTSAMRTGHTTSCTATLQMKMYVTEENWHWVTVDTWQDSLQYPGSGPEQVEVLIDAFIRQDNMPHPLYPMVQNLVYSGDGRLFSYEGFPQSRSRIASVYGVKNSAISDDDISRWHDVSVGETQESDAETSLDAPVPFGHLTWSARDDPHWDYPEKLRWHVGVPDWSSNYCSAPTRLGESEGYETSSIRFTCQGAAVNGLFDWTPWIDWRLEFTLIFGNGEAGYRVNVCHDGFPSYETYLNQERIHGFLDSADPSALLGSCDVSGVVEGVIR